MVKDIRELEQKIAAAGTVASSLFLVILGAINLVHNVTGFFGGATGRWLPAVFLVLMTSVIPMGLGCWLLLRKPGVPSATAKHAGEATDSRNS